MVSKSAADMESISVNGIRSNWEHQGYHDREKGHNALRLTIHSLNVLINACADNCWEIRTSLLLDLPAP